ncbi:hypothetical protein ACI2JA_03365 [Alkalihalobacillus sp. NPDC078783]
MLTNTRGDQVIENAEIFEQEYVTVKIDVDVEAMKQGYLEMAGINQEISNEMLHIENEADVITEKLVTEGKGAKIDYSKLDW